MTRNNGYKFIRIFTLHCIKYWSYFTSADSSSNVQKLLPICWLNVWQNQLSSLNWIFLFMYSHIISNIILMRLLFHIALGLILFIIIFFRVRRWLYPVPTSQIRCVHLAFRLFGSLSPLTVYCQAILQSSDLILFTVIIPKK